MTATDELRKMLDERGIEYERSAWSCGSAVWWHDANGIVWRAHDNDEDELLSLYAYSSVTPEQAIAATLGPVITGDTSDGYHTFNELYHHRAVLFSVVVRDHATLAWKSKLHHDGTMYDSMFIVGIETPQGQATYHYDIDPYWDMFECKELDRAPEWDGHTPDEAIARIATLDAGTCHDKNGFDFMFGFECTACGTMTDGYMVTTEDTGHYTQFNFCPNCGARVAEVDE